MNLVVHTRLKGNQPLSEIFTPEVASALEKAFLIDPEDQESFIKHDELLLICRANEKLFTILSLHFYEDPASSKLLRRIRNKLYELSNQLEEKGTKMLTINK